VFAAPRLLASSGAHTPRWLEPPVPLPALGLLAFLPRQPQVVEHAWELLDSYLEDWSGGGQLVTMLVDGLSPWSPMTNTAFDALDGSSISPVSNFSESRGTVVSTIM
jgi:hypothetical protein